MTSLMPVLMGSGLFVSPFDELVDKATSENLPVGTEDLPTNLEVADRIKSKVVAPKAATTSLRRRINHKNPNVQLLALKLTDTCVKNSGHHFLQEVASREFADNIVSLARLLGGNMQVRQKALELIQTWGIAFKSKPDLSYFCEIYETLKREGTQFPPVEHSAISAAIIDTQTVPEWTDSDICMRCRTAFTTFNRKHHCRNCGQTYCNDCSLKRIPLQHLAVMDAVRVCDSCFVKLTSKSGAAAASSSSASAAAAVTASDKNESAATRDDLAKKEEEDIARAIAASLANTSINSRRTDTGKSSASVRPTVRFKDQEPVEDDDSDKDEDLKRAIAESLKTSSGRSNASSSSTQSSSARSDSGGTGANAWSYPNGSATASTHHDASIKLIGSTPANAATSTELDNVRMFAELVERTEADVAARRISVLNPAQLQVLYTQVEQIQIKLHASLEHAAQRYKMLYDMNEQIDGAVRMYDQFLQQRLAVSQQQQQHHVVSAGGVPYGYPVAGAPPHQHQAAPGTVPHQWAGQHGHPGYPPGSTPPAGTGTYAPGAQPQYMYGAPTAIPGGNPQQQQQPQQPPSQYAPYGVQNPSIAPPPQSSASMAPHASMPNQPQHVYAQPPMPLSVGAPPGMGSQGPVPVQHQQQPPPKPVVQEAPLIEL